jgi:hypothetical protein
VLHDSQCVFEKPQHHQQPFATNLRHTNLAKNFTQIASILLPTQRIASYAILGGKSGEVVSFLRSLRSSSAMRPNDMRSFHKLRFRANRAEQHGSQHALVELDSSLGPEIRTYTQPAGPFNPRVQSEACFEQRATTGRQSYRSWPQCFLHGIYGFREVTHSAGFCQKAARRQQERVLFNHQ